MNKGQFIINTGGRCFLCLRGKVKPKPGPGSTKGSTSKGDEVRNTLSFQNICHYLKLSLRDVLAETISVSSSSLPNLEESELKGTFCSECAQLLGSFSSHYLEVEVARMKLEHSLRSIYEKMKGKGKESDRETLEQFRKEMLGKSETLAQYGIVEQLRRKTLERCSRKLSKAPPRVVIGKLSDVVILPNATSTGVKKEYNLPADLSLLLPPPSFGHQYLGQGLQGYQNPLMDMDIEDDSNPCTVECDVCHLKVTDLFAHFSTAHMEMQGVVVEEPITGQGLPPPPPILQRVKPPKQGPKCDLCGRTFTTRGSLNRHRRSFHFAKILKTSDPSQKPNAGSLGLPTYSKPVLDPKSRPPKATKLRYECPQCSKEFSLLSAYNRHHRTVHAVTAADIPGVKSNIDKVIATLHENKAFKRGKRIGKMNKSSASASPIKRGRGRPSKSLASTISPSTIKRGRGRPKRDLDQKCELCGMKFKQKEILLRHQRIFHRNKVAKQEEGSSQSNVQAPLNGNGEGPPTITLSDPNPTLSPAEGDPESGSGSLPPNIQEKLLPAQAKRRNLRNLFTFNIHTGRPQCNLCLLEFSSPSNFGSHYNRVHLNLRYDCDECGKQFRDKNTLTDHQNIIHKGIRFPCHCGKSFNLQRLLVKHQRLGKCTKKKTKKIKSVPKAKPTPTATATTGLKYTYRCSTCGAGFTGENQLIDHFRSEHL